MSNKEEDKALRRKRRKDKEQEKTGPLSPTNSFRLMNSDAPLYGCWINKNWQNSGMAYTIVARKMSTGLIMFVMFWMNTIKGTLEDCWGDINLTEATFRKNILQKDTVELFQAELSLIQGLIAQVATKSVEKGYPLPDQYRGCLKLVGPLDLHHVEPQQIPATPTIESYRIAYAIKDVETLETELLQLPMLLEGDDSTLERKHFIWRTTQRTRSAKDKGEVRGDLVLQNETLTLEASNQSALDQIHHSLLQYLGTSISLSKKNIRD